jgi:outer membrane receptor protein involved in Fe transport
MRTILLTSLIVSAVGCAAYTAPESPAPTTTASQTAAPDDRNVFCFIDGRTMSCDSLQSQDPATIDRIDVLKGSAAAGRYGPSAEGAIVITSKPSLAADRQAADPSDRIFFFIDGRTASQADFRSLPQETIDQIEVLKNAAAVNRFGSEARAGAILVTTKRSR